MTATNVLSLILVLNGLVLMQICESRCVPRRYLPVGFVMPAHLCATNRIIECKATWRVCDLKEKAKKNWRGKIKSRCEPAYKGITMPAEYCAQRGDGSVEACEKPEFLLCEWEEVMQNQEKIQKPEGPPEPPPKILKRKPDEPPEPPPKLPKVQGQAGETYFDNYYYEDEVEYKAADDPFEDLILNLLALRELQDEAKRKASKIERLSGSLFKKKS